MLPRGRPPLAYDEIYDVTDLLLYGVAVNDGRLKPGLLHGIQDGLVEVGAIRLGNHAEGLWNSVNSDGEMNFNRTFDIVDQGTAWIKGFLKL